MKGFKRCELELVGRESYLAKQTAAVRLLERVAIEDAEAGISTASEAPLILVEPNIKNCGKQLSSHPT